MTSCLQQDDKCRSGSLGICQGWKPVKCFPPWWKSVPPMYHASSLACAPFPSRLRPRWVLLKSSQWPPVSACLALTAKHASPGSISHYHFCPGREKQRSKTALGDPNREYLKYQRNGKWGRGYFFTFASFAPAAGRLFWALRGGGRKGQGSRDGVGNHGAAGRKQDLEGGKEQRVQKSPLLPKPESLRSHAQTHVHALGIWLQCRFWFSRSGVGPKSLHLQQTPRCCWPEDHTQWQGLEGWFWSWSCTIFTSIVPVFGEILGYLMKIIKGLQSIMTSLCFQNQVQASSQDLQSLHHPSQTHPWLTAPRPMSCPSQPYSPETNHLNCLQCLNTPMLWHFQVFAHAVPPEWNLNAHLSVWVNLSASRFQFRWLFLQEAFPDCSG